MTHATSPPLSENATSSPTFADVARFIAGPDAPTWLVEHFARWSQSLMLDCSVEKMQPTRVAMKERLDVVRDAASKLQHALRHTPTREFLEIAPSGPIEYRVAFEHMLQDLVGRAERAMTSPALSTEDGKTRPGRTKAAPPGASSAKLFCAALIAETWAYFHGVDPAPRNQDAAAAAHTLWRALRKSITFDNDTAFAQHGLLQSMRAMATWFCDAYASWQKGGVENANGRLRRWLPRHIDIDRLSDAEIQDIVITANLTPRKCLGFKTPFQAILKELGKDAQIRFS